jgi:hypothetical protein
MSSSAVSTTQAMGTVVMATDYDVIDANYAGKREMEICEFSTSATSFNSQIHPIECDPTTNVLAEHYIQYGATKQSDFPDDPRFGCMGNFQIATVGMPTSGQVVGELWVTYDVELLKPQLNSVLSAGASEYHVYGSTNTAGSTTATVASGGWPVPSPFTYTTNYPASPTALTYIFTALVTGSYLVIVNAQAAGASALGVAPLMSPTGGATQQNMFSTASGNFLSPAAATGNLGTYTAEATIVISAIGQGMIVGMPWNVSQPTYFDIVIVPYSHTVSGRRRAQTLLDVKLAERDERYEALIKRLSRLESSEQGAAAYSSSSSSSSSFGSGTRVVESHTCGDDSVWVGPTQVIQTPSYTQSRASSKK